MTTSRHHWSRRWSSGYEGLDVAFYGCASSYAEVGGGIRFRCLGGCGRRGRLQARRQGQRLCGAGGGCKVLGGREVFLVADGVNQSFLTSCSGERSGDTYPLPSLVRFSMFDSLLRFQRRQGRLDVNDSTAQDKQKPLSPWFALKAQMYGRYRRKSDRLSWRQLSRVGDRTALRA